MSQKRDGKQETETEWVMRGRFHSRFGSRWFSFLHRSILSGLKDVGAVSPEARSPRALLPFHHVSDVDSVFDCVLLVCF